MAGQMRFTGISSSEQDCREYRDSCLTCNHFSNKSLFEHGTLEYFNSHRMMIEIVRSGVF